ncbi:aflatoxin B1 aldehyde reductase member 2-like isoform X2 [Halichondria panicea]|uniref:aflatoxin B1 aldehyde reductase member 2-like isoform X2 n=1 Tax=Halichondria panicea TaxID=6063 RepID=UPI00312B5ACA
MADSTMKVVLGTMEIGRGALSEDTPSFELLDAYFTEGQELDTALMYAGGNSELIIGRYLTARSLQEKAVIATKANPFGSHEKNLAREGVLAQAALSLQRLQASSVDIFYLHAPDHDTPIEETLEAVQQLYTDGKFKELGLSNFASWEVANVYQICKSRGWVLPTVYQGMYNPITRMVESELLPCLRHFGIRFYAYNPLAGGMLTERYYRSGLDTPQDGRFWTVGGDWAVKYRDRFWRESVFRGVECVRGALDECYGVGVVSLVRAAFRWLNHHSAINAKYNDAIIVGVSKMEHLKANMAACQEGPLDERTLAHPLQLCV